MAIRIVVAGLGGRGQDWVREVRASGGFALAGCVEVEPAVLASAASKLNIPSELCFATLDQALNHVACDAVIVATSVGQLQASRFTAGSQRAQGCTES